MPFSSSTCCGAHLTIWVHHCHPQQLYKALSIVHYPFPLCRLHSPCPLCLPDMGSYTQLHLTNTLSFIEHIRLIFSIWLLSTVCIRPCDCWSSDCSGFWNSLKLRKSPCQSKIQMDVAGRASPRQSFSNPFFWQAVYHSVVLNGSGAVVGPVDGTQHHRPHWKHEATTYFLTPNAFSVQ